MSPSKLAPLVLTALLASAGIAGAEPTPADGTKASADGHETAAMLKRDMRRLWTDHVVWTRDYIIAALGDQPDVQAGSGRLMKNQEDIGNALAVFYGAPAGQELTALLKQHIILAGEVLTAAKAGDKTAQAQADAKWQKNGVDIAEFLSKANPHLSRSTMADMMKQHLATTTDEVAARLTKNWYADAQAYDAVYDHILHMSDALSDGIVKQFPEKFGNTPRTSN